MERNGNGMQVPEVNVCIHIISKTISQGRQDGGQGALSPGPQLLEGPIIKKFRLNLDGYQESVYDLKEGFFEGIIPQISTQMILWKNL